MSRSIWKGPHVDASLMRKIAKMRQSGTSVFRTNTWSRRSVILPEFVGLYFNVYNGQKWRSILVTQEMIGHKLGEFAVTRKIVQHKKKK